MNEQLAASQKEFQKIISNELNFKFYKGKSKLKDDEREKFDQEMLTKILNNQSKELEQATKHLEKLTKEKEDLDEELPDFLRKSA